jgi:hypothetical protein
LSTVSASTFGRPGFRLDTFGGDVRLTDLLAELTTDSPRAKALALGDRCGARFEGCRLRNTARMCADGGWRGS